MKRIHQTLLLVGLMAFLPHILSGCHNNTKTTEERTRANRTEQKSPVDLEDTFHRTREKMDGSISRQWLLSDSLSEHATIEELKELAASHKDPIMRLIAFRALLSKDAHQAVNLTISNIDDTAIVKIFNVDCLDEDRVSNIRICMLQYNRGHYQITQNDSARVDSAALFSTNIPLYDYSYRLYHHLPAKPIYENRLRQLYKQDMWALVALAKFHREKERQEIIRLLSQADYKDSWNYRDTLRAALHAAAAWPDATFKPLVQRECQKILEQTDTIECCGAAFRALIAYHTKWSYDMAEKALARAKQDNNYYVLWHFHEEYEDNPQPLFKPLTQKYPWE